MPVWGKAEGKQVSTNEESGMAGVETTKAGVVRHEVKKETGTHSRGSE